MADLLFDHAFTTDQNHYFLNSLGKNGFKIEEDTVNHPNSICRFIKFNNQKYLEFISAPNQSSADKMPGLSFCSDRNLLKIQKKLNLKGIESRFEHRNYDWESNSSDYLPGWNFLTFKNLPFRTILPWVTEYELRVGVKRRKNPIIKHPNRVSSIAGLHFELNSKGESYFEKLLGRKIKDKIEFKDGMTFYFSQGRLNLFKNVILESENFNHTTKYFSESNLQKWNGKLSIRVLNTSKNKRMWDLIIV